MFLNISYLMFSHGMIRHDSEPYKGRAIWLYVWLCLTTASAQSITQRIDLTESVVIPS